MENKLTNKEIRGINTFLTETFSFTAEQLAAIDHQIPMTQELFDAIIDRCNELGEGADRVFFCMLEEYPEFMMNGAKKILDEVAEVK